VTLPDYIVAVDVGNSAIKVAVAKESDLVGDSVDLTSDGGMVSYQTFPIDQSDWERRVCQWVRQHSGARSVCCSVSTVNHAASRPLHDVVRDQQWCWKILSRKDVPLQIEVDYPDRVGIDRLLSAHAASNRFASPIVVVDAGSAVTVDSVQSDPSGRQVFAGGAILPGIRLQHAALVTGTEGLQQSGGHSSPIQSIDLADNGAMRPAKNTEQAIQLGVIAAVAGGIERLAREYVLAQDTSIEQEKGGIAPSCRLVLTGGDAPTISAYLRAKHDLIPNLVCMGILDLAIRQCQIAPSGLK